MIRITAKNRSKIIEDYVDDLIDSMDWDSLYAFAYESLMESKSRMNNKALELEIIDYYPYLLEK